MADPEFASERSLSTAQRELLQQLIDVLESDDSASTGAARAALLERLLGHQACRRLAIYPLPPDFVLSVIIPVFNESATVQQIIQRVRDTGLPVEIILVDDGSTDGTRALLSKLPDTDDCQVILHSENRGKGAAVRTGLAAASGAVVVIQDADTEYDPRDFRWLLQPIINDEADVVYGSRFVHDDRPVSPLWHRAANRLITMWASFVSGYRFTDVETCYKMMRRDLVSDIAATLRERRFGIEIELTMKLLRQPGVRFRERPINYRRRSYEEGKKIGWRDGIAALWCVVRYRFGK